MYSLTITNQNTDEALTFNELDGQFRIKEIEGLGPVTADVITDQLALRDGAIYNTARLRTRQLNVAFVILSNPEEGRLKAYRVLAPRAPLQIRYVSESLDVYAIGYIESVPVQHFAMINTLTASIICPDPYWSGMQEMINEMDTIEPRFHFEFYSKVTPSLVFGSVDQLATIYIPNPSGIETGLTIEMYFRDVTSYPQIYDVDTQAKIWFDLTTQAGDLITITTYTGRKTAMLTRGGVTTNILDKVIQGSTWLQLGPRGSMFGKTYEVGSSGDFDVTFYHREQYLGV